MQKISAISNFMKQRLKLPEQFRFFCYKKPEVKTGDLNVSKRKKIKSQKTEKQSVKYGSPSLFAKIKGDMISRIAERMAEDIYDLIKWVTVFLIFRYLVL